MLLSADGCENARENVANRAQTRASVDTSTATLAEANILGASFSGKDPSFFKKAEVTFWLKCGGVKVKSGELKATLDKK